jgi:hypothetical protein
MKSDVVREDEVLFDVPGAHYELDRDDAVRRSRATLMQPMEGRMLARIKRAATSEHAQQALNRRVAQLLEFLLNLRARAFEKLPDGGPPGYVHLQRRFRADAEQTAA